MQIEYRDAAETDLEFLDALHTACMKKHVSKIYPWKPLLFRQTFNPKAVQIVLDNGVQVGMLQTDIREHEIYLANLLIAPAFQKRRIGSIVLRRVLALSGKLKLPIKLQVLRRNQAKRFYERFGFAVIEETNTHHVLSRAVSQERSNVATM